MQGRDGLGIIFILFHVMGPSAHSKIEITSGKNQIPLIELYSSEGCSSCPPAEAWMADLLTQKKAFVDFVPVNFHVDYWNRLGWIDRFSKVQFTERQSAYAAKWSTRRIYTPAFVVNGEDRGSSGNKLWLNVSKKTSGVLSVRSMPKDIFEIEYQPVNGFSSAEYQVFAASLGHGLESKVSSGENKGVTLKHNFVVLELRSSSLEKNKARLVIDSRKLDNASVKPASWALAVWVTKKGEMTPLQAVGGPWPD